MPLRVAKNTNRSSLYSRTCSTACTFSPSSSGIQLTIGRPRALGPASGNWCTGSQNTRPALVKVSSVSWVLTSHSLSMKSSSLVDAAAAAAASLRAIGGDGLAFGIAGVRQGDHDVFRRDQVEDVQVFLAGADLAAARVAELFLEVAQFGADHVEQHVGILEDLDQAADVVQQLAVFLGELLLLQAGQAVQAHLEDLLRLDFRQLVRPVHQAHATRQVLGP